VEGGIILMPDPSLLALEGSQPESTVRFVPLSCQKFFSGLFTQRSPFNGPDTRYETKYLGGRPDMLIDGENIELTNYGTLIRRPGLIHYTNQTLSTPIMAFYSFHSITNGVKVMADTGVETYYITPTAKTSIYTKSFGAGQTYFQGVGDTLYMGNGVDQLAWMGSGSTRNWGIATPLVAPSVANNTAAPLYPVWVASTYYSPSLLIVDTNNNLQLLTTGGQVGAVHPTWNVTVGGTTTDNTAVWTNQGTADWQAGHTYSTGDVVRTTYSVEVDFTNYDEDGNPFQDSYTVYYDDFFICTTPGISGGSTPDWQAGIGFITDDGAVIWTNQSATQLWVSIGANNLVTTVQIISDSNGATEIVSSPGLSGATHPTWATILGQYTLDGVGLLWRNQGLPSASTAGTAPYFYVYSYKNSVSGHVSTASPVSTSIIKAANSYIAVQGARSPDPQVDTVEIYRTAQGGATFQFLTDIPNPSTSAWTFNDSIADSALNGLILAPQADSNDPPPAGMIEMTYHLNRIWGVVDNNVYYSGGPDTLVGNGNEAFPPANVFVFPEPVKRLIAISTGLLVISTDNLYLIPGTTTATFYSLPYQEGIGALNYNAVATQGSNIFMYTSDRQFLNVTETGMNELGYAIGDILSDNYDPANTYVASLIAGTQDKAVYISDGSASWYRCNWNQPPEGGPAWSPKAAIVGGLTALNAIEISLGVHKLLLGQNDGEVLMRDINTFTDDTETYSAFFEIGSFILAQPGQLARVASITTESKAVGTVPSVSVRIDEIAGNFENLPISVNDPPMLSPSTSVLARRFYLEQGQNPVICRHLQMKLSYPSEDAKNELLTLSIFGALHYEE
jgi:hypothetical protein